MFLLFFLLSSFSSLYKWIPTSEGREGKSVDLEDLQLDKCKRLSEWAVTVLDSVAF